MPGANSSGVLGLAKDGLRYELWWAACPIFGRYNDIRSKWCYCPISFLACSDSIFMLCHSITRRAALEFAMHLWESDGGQFAGTSKRARRTCAAGCQALISADVVRRGVISEEHWLAIWTSSICMFIGWNALQCFTSMLSRSSLVRLLYKGPCKLEMHTVSNSLAVESSVAWKDLSQTQTETYTHTHMYIWLSKPQQPVQVTRSSDHCFGTTFWQVYDSKVLSIQRSLLFYAFFSQNMLAIFLLSLEPLDNRIIKGPLRYWGWRSPQLCTSVFFCFRILDWWILMSLTNWILWKFQMKPHGKLRWSFWERQVPDSGLKIEGGSGQSTWIHDVGMHWTRSLPQYLLRKED